MDIIGKKTLREMWDDLADAHGRKTALVFEDCDGNSSSYSYAGLNREINKAANLFLSLGVAKGDRVIIHLNNCPELIFCWFGLAKIGALMVPVNTQYVYRECEYIAEKCGAGLAVCSEEYLPIYQALAANKGKIKRIMAARLPEDSEQEGADNFNRLLRGQPDELSALVELSVDDPAEILFTSGTTSKPKGAVITHYNLRFAGYYTAWQAAIREDDRYLTMMPAFHVDFQCTAAMPAFSMGATFIMLEKYSATRFWSQVCLYRATLTECLPLMVRTLMLQPQKAWEKEHCLRDIFFYLTLSEQEKEAFIKRFNVRLLTSYGMTETIVGLIGDCPGDKRRWPSIGRPGLCYEAKVVDAQGNEMPPGRIGELMVRGEPGKTLFKEYYDDPEATASAIDPDGWLRTGDTASTDEDGWFYFADRHVDLIKRSGENISSGEIENILADHPRISEAAVIGLPDSMRDEAVKAFVLPVQGERITEEEVLEYCRAHMAKFKVPAFVEICESLPRTCTGKVQKKYLRHPELAEEEDCPKVPEK